MFARVHSVHYLGLDTFKVEVEVDIVAGLPSFNIVGLPDAAIKESRERVRSAIQNSEYDFPLRKITVNLAPADVKKEGPSFDLPIAIAILKATGQIKKDLSIFGYVGELSLKGNVRSINGSLLLAEAAKKSGKKVLLLPQENAKEASLIQGIDIIPASSLKEAVEHLNESAVIEPYGRKPVKVAEHEYSEDIEEVKGQLFAKRALEIAAAGGHNVLMVGSPGAGKSMLAKRLPTIMPPLTEAQVVAVTKIYSVNGMTGNGSSVVQNRPFRSPHHTISSAALIGGGSNPKPGEISLSHFGVLFLDELTEFRKDVLEALRQPLEDGKVCISRVQRQHTYPANICLVAAMNPCRCGYYGDKVKQCKCTPNEIRRYRQKLSGPLLERIDLHVGVDRLSKEELLSHNKSESSEVIRGRVAKASNLQRQRFKSHFKRNAIMKTADMKNFCALEKGSFDFLENAIEKLGLSGRSYDKVLKISRTIADLAESEIIKKEHLAEAIQFRQYDRQTIY